MLGLVPPRVSAGGEDDQDERAVAEADSQRWAAGDGEGEGGGSGGRVQRDQGDACGEDRRPCNADHRASGEIHLVACSPGRANVPWSLGLTRGTEMNKCAQVGQSPAEPRPRADLLSFGGRARVAQNIHITWKPQQNPSMTFSLVHLASSLP
jgi:hypothetical protein